MTDTTTARRILEEAIRARVFPAVALDVGSGAGSMWSEALGSLTFDTPDAPVGVHTPFDLASLTKVIATTTVVMQLVSSGRLRVDERVADGFPDWRGEDRRTVTIGDLLEHASGLSARLVDAPPDGRREFEHDICAMPLEYPPRARSIYSDLGFILLGFLVADRGGASLAKQFDEIMARLKPEMVPLKAEMVRLKAPFDGALDGPEAFEGPDSTYGGVLAFGLLPHVRRLAAPTLPIHDDARRGRRLAGEVHDHYAAALGGVAGHAGLFGTAAAVGAFARVMLRAARGDERLPLPFSPAQVRAFTTRSAVPGSSRAFGWDTMLPTSSCGSRMSPRAFGHVGFTGTSLWVDPARDRYVVLLTNRACGGGTLDQMRHVRRTFHDALGDV